MKDENAQALLAKVMGWDSDATIAYVPKLQLLADFKFDQYQRFAPGKRFIESLALWLNQFADGDRQAALDFCARRAGVFLRTRNDPLGPDCLRGSHSLRARSTNLRGARHLSTLYYTDRSA